MRKTLRQFGWFIGLWAMGVLSVLILAYIIRWVILYNFALCLDEFSAFAHMSPRSRPSWSCRPPLFNPRDLKHSD